MAILGTQIYHEIIIYSFQGPNKPVTGPCMSTTEESDTRRSVRLCDASTACSGNIEELFFNRYLQKSDASVDWLVKGNLNNFTLSNKAYLTLRLRN